MKQNQSSIKNSSEFKDYQKLAEKHGIKLPNFDSINKYQQAFAWSCRILTYITFVLMVIIPLPYNTRDVYPSTGTVFKTNEMLAMFEVLMLSIALNFHYSNLVFYQLTYKDGIKLIRKMERVGLITTHISGLIITMIKKEQFVKESDKRTEFQKTIEYIEKKYNDEQISNEVKRYIIELESENKNLKKDLDEFQEISADIKKEMKK